MATKYTKVLLHKDVYKDLNTLNSVDTKNTKWTSLSQSSLNKNPLFTNCGNLSAAYNLNAETMVQTFYGCTSLTTPPTIPNGVTNMTQTFANCTSLATAPTIPDSVKHMTQTFANCTSLATAPTIPNAVIDMTQTFMGCASLTSMPTIPNSVNLMSGTFANCTNLATVKSIPNSVTNMSNTFLNCTSLTSMPTIGTSVTNMSYTFSGCTNLSTIKSIPNSVTTLANAFYRCTSLTTSPTIGNSVTNMSLTFAFCASLTSMPTIPSSVTNMSFTFSECTSLESVSNIPNSVTNMQNTFYKCYSLTSMPTIGTSVTNMAETFFDCRNLATVTAIPNSVTTLASAFYGCTSLTETPTIGNSVTNMQSTFFGCTSLEEITNIPESVTSMAGTFKGCKSLTSTPAIPSSVTNMHNTFYGCNNLAGDIIILSTQVAAATDCFKEDPTQTAAGFPAQQKTIYLPFTDSSGNNTVTYTAFLSAGYSSTIRKDGVILSDLQLSGNATLTINPLPSDATVVLTAEGYTQQGNSITVPVLTTVSYTISKTNYVTKSGTILVASTSTKSISLEAFKSFSIEPIPVDSIVTLTSAGYTQQGNSIYVPANTNVAWSVARTGYVSQSNTQLVANNNITKYVTLSEIPYTLTIYPTPNDATVELTAAGYTQQGNSITVLAGTTVTYSVSKSGYNTETGSYTLERQNVNLNISLINNTDLTNVVTNNSSATLPVGVYKYIMVGAGGGGYVGRQAIYNTQRSRSGGSGGAGGGSGYVKVGYFSTVGESFNFVIGQGGVSNTDGGNTYFTGQLIGTVDTAEGGKTCNYNAVPVMPRGGDGGSGGGAGGMGGAAGSSVVTPKDGTRGGLGGGNGEDLPLASTTYTGGIGYYAVVKSYDSNAGVFVSGTNQGTPGGAGRGLISIEHSIKDKSTFLNLTLQDCYNALSGGGGGSHSKIPGESESNPQYYGGPGGGGGSWTYGYAGVIDATSSGTGGSGGKGAIIYRKLDGYSLVISPTPSDATVTLNAAGYTQIRNGISVPNNTTVNYIVSKTGYDTVTGTKVVTQDEALSVGLNVTMCTFTIIPAPADSIVVLTASGYTQQGNSITVPYGTTVNYSVSKSGYSAVVDSEVVTETKSINVTLRQYPTLTINPTPADATVTLTASGYTQQGNSITVLTGTTVNWSVAKSGYLTRTGSYTMSSVDITLNIELFVDTPILVDTTTTVTLPAGTYKYIAVGGGGAGGSGGRLAYARDSSMSGGGGGGSGYLTAGTFTTSGESFTFTIGQGGTPGTTTTDPGTDGGPSSIVGTTIGTVTTANGGHKGASSTPTSGAAYGGAGFAGGGAGGKAARKSNTSYSLGGSGGNYGCNGVDTNVASGGLGSRNSTASNAGNAATETAELPPQTPSTVGVNRYSNILGSNFDTIANAIINSTYSTLQYPEGGAGGAGGWGTTYTAAAGGAGGAGYYAGSGSQRSASTVATDYPMGGIGGNGAIIYKKIS